MSRDIDINVEGSPTRDVYIYIYGRNYVFVQRGIRAVKLPQQLGRRNTVVILLGDVIRGNRWVVQAEIERYNV